MPQLTPHHAAPQAHEAKGVPVLALRPRDAAASLGISPRTLWALTRDGKIPHLRLGTGRGLVVYPVQAIERWLAEQAEANVTTRA